MNENCPRPPFPEQQQVMPGSSVAMDPPPDHGEESYKGSGRLAGKRAIITGGDSGIGRAAALACAREGADVLISYYDEHDDVGQLNAWWKEQARNACWYQGTSKIPPIAR